MKKKRLIVLSILTVIVFGVFFVLRDNVGKTKSLSGDIEREEGEHGKPVFYNHEEHVFLNGNAGNEDGNSVPEKKHTSKIRVRGLSKDDKRISKFEKISKIFSERSFDDDQYWLYLVSDIDDNVDIGIISSYRSEMVLYMLKNIGDLKIEEKIPLISESHYVQEDEPESIFSGGCEQYIRPYRDGIVAMRDLGKDDESGDSIGVGIDEILQKCTGEVNKNAIMLLISCDEKNGRGNITNENGFFVVYSDEYNAIKSDDIDGLRDYIKNSVKSGRIVCKNPRYDGPRYEYQYIDFKNGKISMLKEHGCFPHSCPPCGS